ncbi:ABC transporter permease [Lacticaseibacillus rhamnosus]|uniref:ABC transporter permease n=1 Tax=Lacticaseibacillus rhamnosus TaxID=47715 RepID=UPI0019508653|nr:ABC transporter permease [Lacticaseibacillus rhamnosus]MBM6439409.1 ABC transporter permease [Lacticaseibacillus rhamnosus]
MRNNLAEEFYKFYHQKTFFYGILTLLFLMFYGGITSNVNQATIAFGFGAIQWIPIIIIAIGSSFFEMEYRNNTILMLLYKNSSKLKIYIAKFLTIFLYGVFLTIVAALFTIILKLILTGDQYHWLADFNKNGSLLTTFMLNMAGTLIYSFFVEALSFMLIMLIKVNTAVIGIGLAIGFFGASISVALTKTFTTLIGVVKWNPLNMIFVTQQLSNASYINLSQLDNLQIIGGTILYGLIFAFLGYGLFKRRRI